MDRADADEDVHVLHVDDNPHVLDLVARYLQLVDEGLTVVSETDAAVALERLAEERADCVVSDYEMPGVDGLEFLARVRERHPTVPFLLYTGKGSEEIAAAAISEGVDDYVRKDSGEGHYTVLANRIRRATDQVRVQRERDQRLAALEAAREGICILDESGRVAYANEAYCDLYGYEADELLGESWRRVHPEAEAERLTVEVLPQVREGGEWAGHGTGLRADETEFQESKSIVPLPGGGLVIVVLELQEDPDGSVTDPNQRAVDALDRALDAGSVTGETAALVERTRERLADGE